MQLLSSLPALLDENPLVVMPPSGGVSPEALEVQALERHVSSYSLLLEQALEAGGRIDSPASAGEGSA